MGREAVLIQQKGGQEGEFLHDEVVEEAKVLEQPPCIVKPEDYNYLLSKAISASGLWETPAEDDSTSAKPDVKSKVKRNQEFPPRHNKIKEVFRFPKVFEWHL